MFGLAALAGAALLTLPVSAESGTPTGFVTALFTATGAICGGLASVDTGTHWSTFGEVVVLVLIQVGGLGIMTLASLLALLMSRRLGLRMQLTAAAETNTVGLNDLRRVLAGVLLAAPSTWESSTPSRPSTTPASVCTATTSSASPPIR